MAGGGAWQPVGQAGLRLTPAILMPLPRTGWRPTSKRHLAAAATAHPDDRQGSWALLGTLSAVFDRRAVTLHLATGVENEHVPLNETGYLLPWWQRTLIRSSIVLAVTAVSILVVSIAQLDAWWRVWGDHQSAGTGGQPAKPPFECCHLKV